MAGLPAWDRHPWLLQLFTSLAVSMVMLPLTMISFFVDLVWPAPRIPQSKHKVRVRVFEWRGVELEHLSRVTALQRLRAPICAHAQTILITGASSGIGRALAVEYAAPGVTLLLTGRNEDRLAGVQADCESRGAQVVLKALDVTDRAATEAWVSAMDEEHCVDMVVANAGVTAETLGLTGPQRDAVSEVTRQLFSTNVDGVFNTVLPLVAPMKARGAGQIVLMASQASFAPTFMYSYGATKAAVRFWGEGLRQDLAAWGVAVNVVCPGFVRSPMTDEFTFDMLGLVDMQGAVAATKEGLEANTAVICFPAVVTIATSVLNAVAPTLRDVLARLGVLHSWRQRRSQEARQGAMW